MAATFLSCAWSITPCYLNIFISHSLGGISVWFSHTLHFYIDHLVQSLSHVQLFATPWTAACQASLSITNSWSLLKLMSIESVTPSNHLILCHPLLFLPSIFPSIRVFSNESVLRIRWPKYWSFSFSVSPFNEYSGLISFRMDWLDHRAVPGTLNSLLQYHSWFTGKDCNAGKDRAGKEGDDRGWDGWKTSLTQWTWVWANSGIEWRTRKPGVLQSMGLQRVRPNWVMNNSNTQRGLKFTGLQNADCVEGVVRQL